MTQSSRIVRLRADQLPGPHTRENCRQCTFTDGYLARYIHQNGAVAIRWVCDWCEDFKTAPDLPHSILPDGVTLADLPLRQDNTDLPRDFDSCVVCGDDALHQHHWAPRAIFPDWPDGLVVPLCILHHNVWHDRMRSHGLRWPHELEAA